MAWFRKDPKETEYALIGLGATVLGGFIGWGMAGEEGAMIGAVMALLVLTLF